jgi:hypothetical protein
MEFDWSGYSPEEFSPKDVEESFEDPFSIRIMPDIDEADGREARYFLLGRSLSNLALFSVFWTDGKLYRVVFSRAMTPEEEAFYERKNSEQN